MVSYVLSVILNGDGDGGGGLFDKEEYSLRDQCLGLGVGRFGLLGLLGFSYV